MEKKQLNNHVLSQCKMWILPKSIRSEKISDEEYFSSKYDDYISNSRLKLIDPEQGGSPELFFNPPKQEYNVSLEIGSAIHELLLQPESFELNDYEFKPSGKVGKFIEELANNRKSGKTIYESLLSASESSNYYNGKLSKKILKNAMSKGKQYYSDLIHDKFNNFDKKQIILSPKAFFNVYDCMNVIKDSKIKRFLSCQNITETKQNFNEEAIFADISVKLPECEAQTFKFKLKIDNYSIDDENKTITLNDLKTTSKQLSFFMGNYDNVENIYEGSFMKYHYYRQLAIYLYFLQILYHDKYPDYSYLINILAIESFGPEYNNDIYRIKEEYIKAGLIEFKSLMCRVAFHKIYGCDKKITDIYGTECVL